MDLDLSRTDMIEHLKMRGIYVPDAEGLPMEQLEDIYRGFVVPRPKRERERGRDPKPIPMEMEQLTQRIKSVAVVGRKRAQPPADSDTAKQFRMDRS
ncbi:uncharacterized protein LOC108097927 [Drosophila ficusphila]|uniref:uncharacterized protein LOC108097927 n=1 Tax=Drosophila ficusphila TaxID=30025 RepID=UPI0007E6EFD9|nr:uncharacterized protein LOC108097927 [Drosophila ficusphila]